jgi:hypothetical protein
MALNGLVVNEVLRLQDLDAKRLGLDRLDEDELMLAFARWAEAHLKRWVDYARGALLFLMVPDDPESGAFYIYDRARQTFFLVDQAQKPRYGGYGLQEFDQMAAASGLKALAREPRGLPWHCGETFESGRRLIV